ncbi:hypothetical protein K458DRAFT_303653, partial [Lentithecium fluviatile CBS 122367]
TLYKYLENYYFAFINNVLVYLDKNKKHRDRKIIKKLEATSLYLDIKKSKFKVKKTKYLGFIIEVEKEISIDPKKVKVILE